MSQELKRVISLIREAGRKVLEFYQNNNCRRYKKADGTLVTEADLASEKILRQGLSARYHWPILSEESQDNLPERLNKEKVWIIDPLDGTNDFLDKTGDFAIMAALTHRGKAVLGVIFQPTEEKLYFAQKGQGAYLKQGARPVEELSVSSLSTLAESRLLVSRSHLSNQERVFIRISGVKKFSRVGSVGVKAGLIAEGRAEAYVSFSNKTSQWDICAPEIILTEAGGKVTDLRGREFVYNRPQIKNRYGIVVSNSRIHQQIIAKVNQTLKHLNN